MAAELDTAKIIDGVCLDERIGRGYNNPSLDMVVIAYPKTPNNYSLIMIEFRKI